MTENIQKRYYLIDSVRGFAVLNMIAFHFLYDYFMLFSKTNWASGAAVVIWERFICCSFIIISGMSLNFSRHAYRRGIFLNVCGFAVTAATVLFVPSEAVRFGILNLLGCCMLIAQPLRRLFDKFSPAVGAAASMLCFAAAYTVPHGYLGFFALKLIKLPDALYSFGHLAFLGFRSADFRSSDYFPLLPWLFLFLFGYFLWKCVARIKLDGFFTLKIPVLAAVGKYSIWIYLAHQPIIYGILALLSGGF